MHPLIIRWWQRHRMNNSERMDMELDQTWMQTGEVVESRAPGKVIICGEHAVVHGTGAVAASLNRYTVVRMNRPPAHVGDNGVLSIHLPELEVRLKWTVAYLKQSLPSLDQVQPNPLTSVGSENIKIVISEFVEKEMPRNSDKGSIGGVQAFLFLYVSILGLRPLEAVVTSELPVGAGLGSSAAFCVSVSGALLTLAGKLDFHPQSSDGIRWKDILDTGLDLVNMWAFEGEKIIHGKPSGVDNTVSCYGHVVHFKKGQITRIDGQVELRMLLTNTKVSRNTKALVAGVGERAERHPEAMAAVFQAVDSISDEVVKVLQSPIEEATVPTPETISQEDEEQKAEERNFAQSLFMSEGMVINTSKTDGNKLSAPPRPKRVHVLTRLEELICMNQGLLQCMGVSHPTIEHICQITSRFNLCSKLTGAGGGGCVFTLLPHDLKDIQKVRHQLQLAGFECFEAAMGGKGLQIGFRSSILPSP
ncbi:mevalonate kinase [Marchantia polymorpha subsp. ruderalis]|uniref:Mevalonate kinase n=2 Tax=Marchantia polymorpha TaxID=3197 RepID=A0AAF6B9I0_MARPO|nr:hypothetical protein MARPO_0214s0007 [Marchantia polymorpha]PTQ27184.1 hypothetical protein MARPO_0214s0007 [Marchantia polymorpha]BBN08664.1 hypothetical protein Mp_4g13410 [Marchantia polymorpha subsp. ruderalis]BBN08665.1 hypothetical protein Mp_4g13410 [Marchantia polymorpha subsp. ruderalis]|eukprot:PTQ27181.1 hypothetical protein MARPO_0214s0007 [Marchantia polymorpha]